MHCFKKCAKLGKNRIGENTMAMAACCGSCLLEKQRLACSDEGYLEEVREIVENRRDCDSPPYLVYLFQQAYERRFGKGSPYGGVKKQYNDLVMAMEDAIRGQIEAAPDPLVQALVYARVGNYIDFGALDHVEEQDFLRLLDSAALSEADEATVASFLRQCGAAKQFLLISDNCGEIVLDKLFLQQLKRRFPRLQVTVMVRGGEVLNDVTAEDAEYTGLSRVAGIVSNGAPVAGTIYDMLSPEAKAALDDADVILAKGQGNYETLGARGRHVFYSMLCKCDLFVERFRVPRFTGIFLEEYGDPDLPLNPA